MPTMAAVDLGAQSGRVAVGRFDGGRLTVDEVHRFPNDPVRSEDRLRWDIDSLYRSTLDGLRAAGRVDSVAVDSWGVDFGLLDAQGRLLEEPVHYRDQRRAAAFHDAQERIRPRELYERTGIQLQPINTLFELAGMAAAGDRALARADRLLMIADLFHHRLCGSSVTELTNATTTQCLDVRTGTWAGDVLDRLEIPTRLFPDVVPPGTKLGTTDDGAVVIAGATHDTGSAVAAAPLTGKGSVYLSIGTWSLIGVELGEPLIDDETFQANLTNEGGVSGTTRLLRNVTGLWLLHECRRVWAEQGEDISFERLVELAREAPPFGALIDPNADAFLEPGDMPARIEEFCRSTGQSPPAGIAATVRCVLESLALKHAETVEMLRRVTGVDPVELCILGGGARNDLLCRWTADASGLPVQAGPEEATLVGNLLVQAMALGEIGSLDEARDVVRASFEPLRYEPQDDHAWVEARERLVAVGT